MRRVSVLLLLSAVAPAARAQVPDSARAAEPAAADTATRSEDTGARWRTSYFPYLTGGANDDPVFTFRVRYWQPADYEARTTYTGALNIDAGIAPHGSRFLAASFQAPGLRKGWRLHAVALAERQVRYGYFGLGNDTENDKDLVTDEDPFLYRMRRARYRIAAELTHRLH